MTDAAMLPWKADHAGVTRRLETLLDTPGVSADYVRARIAILKAQVGVLEALRGVQGVAVDPGPPALGAGLLTPPRHRPKVSQVPVRPEVGRPAVGGSGGVGRPAPNVEPAPNEGPAVRPEMLWFDQDLAAGLLAAVLDAGRRQGPGAEGLERIAAAAARRPELVEDLALRVAFGPEPAHLAVLSQETGAPGELLVFLGRLIAAPLVVDAARRLEELPGATGVSEGVCPICGSAPGLAVLEAEDGHRVLHCGLCGWSWRFARLACARCGCGDQAKLQRLSVDGEDARWIEVCQGCRGYLKTIDRRRLTDPAGLVVLVEEVATLYLDLLAEREGYASGAPYAAMV